MRLTKLITGCFLVLFFAGSVYAKSGDLAGNGGDEDAIAFQNAAAKATAMVVRGLISDVDRGRLSKTLSETKYIAVDEELREKFNRVEQNLAAINFPEQKLIYIQRARWKALNTLLQLQLSLHEVLSLIGIEGSGDYHISGTLSKMSEGQIPSSVLLYESSVDYGTQAFKMCELYKNLYRQTYAVVYCVSRELASVKKWDLQIFGLGKKLNDWKELFSSLDLPVQGTYANQEEAEDACSLALASGLSDPLWIGARCFIQTRAEKFYFLIKTQNQL